MDVNKIIEKSKSRLIRLIKMDNSHDSNSDYYDFIQEYHNPSIKMRLVQIGLSMELEKLSMNVNTSRENKLMVIESLILDYIYCKMNDMDNQYIVDGVIEAISILVDDIPQVDYNVVIDAVEHLDKNLLIHSNKLDIFTFLGWGLDYKLLMFIVD